MTFLFKFMVDVCVCECGYGYGGLPVNLIEAPLLPETEGLLPPPVPGTELTLISPFSPLGEVIPLLSVLLADEEEEEEVLLGLMILVLVVEVIEFEGRRLWY